MRCSILVACLGIAGCQIDFTGHGYSVSTSDPTPEQVKNCREVMYIQPDLEIEPLGYAIESGMDDVIRFKFTAKTDDAADVFDSTHVDASKFQQDFGGSVLRPDANEKWWDVATQELSGANFTVPPPDSSGTRGLNIGYVKNDDNTMTFYVLWFET